MADHFVIYPGAIQGHFEPGGAVHGNANRVGLAIVAAAKAEAPVRTGVLRGSVRRIGVGAMGSLSYIITVTASAQHAPFVLFGTHTPITPFRSKFLSVPRFKGSPRRVGRQYVRGQEANDFLNRGGDLGLAATGYGPIMHETFAGRVR